MPSTTALRLAILASLAACTGGKDESTLTTGTVPSTGSSTGTTTGTGTGATTGTGTGTGAATGTGTGTGAATGTGTGTGGATGTGTGTSTGGTSALCQNPTPILNTFGGPTGLVRCADGAVNRIDDPTSPTSIGGIACTPVIAGASGSSCAVDADCNGGANGACMGQSWYGGGGTDYCSCEYACADDSECNANQACLHPTNLALTAYEAHGTCRVAGCQTDADCTSGECGLSAYRQGGCGTIVQFQCRDDAVDLCRADADCPTVGSYPYFCAWHTGNGRFECQEEPGCTIGRPLRIDGEARTAPTVDRADWLAAVELPASDAPIRVQLAAHWEAVARMEHASVASFARFTLELMALGAPPDLLRDAQQAGIDEVEHARVAFAMASAFAERPLGPGPMSLDGVHPATDVETVVDRLIDEACVGETVGTALLRESARFVVDPALRAVLERTADDETRHAALAWRTLRWLVRARPELRASIPAKAAAAVARLTAELSADDGPAAPEWGLLDREARMAVVESAVLTVVEPCLAAVLVGLPADQVPQNVKYGAASAGAGSA